MVFRLLTLVLFVVFCKHVAAANTLDCSSIVAPDGTKYDLSDLGKLGTQIVEGGNIAPKYWYKFVVCGTSFACGIEPANAPCALGGAAVCQSEDNKFESPVLQTCAGQVDINAQNSIQGYDGGIGVRLEYTGGSFSIKTIVDIFCDKRYSDLERVIFDDSDTQTFRLEISNKQACPVGSAGALPLSIGSMMCIALGGIILFYLVIGITVNVIRKKQGLEIIPNWTFWKGFPSLVFGGCTCLKNTCCEDETPQRPGLRPVLT